MSKRQLGIIIGIVGLLVVVGLFALASNSGPHYFKIPVFQMVYESLKFAAVLFYEISKMIIIGVWHAVTKSWLSGLVSLGLVVLLALLYMYRRSGNLK